MTGFYIAAVLLLVFGAGFLLWPLLRGAGGRQAADAVVTHRRQVKALQADFTAGRIDAVRYETDKRELERKLLDEVAATDAEPAPKRRLATVVVLGVFMLAVPVALYLRLGNSGALLPGATDAGVDVSDGAESTAGEGAKGQAGGARPITPEQVQKMVAALEAGVKKTPDDGAAWSMLARARAYLKQFPAAVEAYQKATALLPRDARLLADYADALAMTSGQRLEGEPLKLLMRALAIDPKDVKALALAGTAAFDHKDYAKAAEYWQRALDSAPNDPEFSQSLRNSLDEARQLAGLPAAPRAAASAPAAPAPPTATAAAAPPRAAAGAAFVRGRVRLAGALADKVKPDDVVFIFARADGPQAPRMPLALLRRQVKELPVDFSLDESMAMMPNLTLSKFSPVVIVARISRSGDAKAASGDLQGLSKPVKVGSEGVAVEIDQVLP